MLRRQARLRREYLYRKSAESKHKSIQSKKNQLKRSLEENIPIHGDLRRQALSLQKKLEWDDKGPERAAVIGGFSGGANTQNSQDDEYRFAGVEDPKIMFTTSREPSSRLKMFVKELRLIFPNSQRMNRGNYEMPQLIHACRANEVTDFIVVHEHRGVPDTLIICHLPYGPTAFFTLSGVIMRHDIPDIGPMSEQYPHLVFHNFKTKLGLRTMSILKYLFPVPKEDSKRVVTFANHDDYICFRQHTYKKVEKQMVLSEIGPRFQMKLYQIKLGTLESLNAADSEWALRPYMNTAAKRRFLSPDDGWLQEDNVADFPVPDFLQNGLTVKEIVDQYWDLSAIPTRYTFALLAHVSEDKLERDKCFELSSPEYQEDFFNYCNRPRRKILEVLQDFHHSTSKLTIDIMFEMFTTIKPRSFSIASSCHAEKGMFLQVLVAVVEYYSKLKKARLGLCSNWLKSLQPGNHVWGWIKKGTLQFPADKTPCIMVGPGTGLAPFRSYILEREAQGTADKDSLILFFGCRYEKEDFHCSEELVRLKNQGKLNLICAFSRDHENKVYVQHKITENGSLVWDLINHRNGTVMISGNAKNMPDNVKDALTDLFISMGHLSKDDAKQYLQNLIKRDQLQVEAW